MNAKTCQDALIINQSIEIIEENKISIHAKMKQIPCHAMETKE